MLNISCQGEASQHHNMIQPCVHYLSRSCAKTSDASKSRQEDLLLLIVLGLLSIMEGKV